MAKRVLVDFDGTLCTYERGKSTFQPSIIEGKPMPGSLEFIDMLHERGYNVFIYSTRALSMPGKLAIEQWCAKEGIEVEGITGCKLPAVAYVDDRAIEFRGDFSMCLDKLDELEERK